MNQLKFEKNYSDNQKLREGLYPLFDKVFGIEVNTLIDFYDRGFWDPTYTPFTFFNKNVAVSNVSVFEMPLLINGEKILAAGIQSVMTHPDYQGNGLMSSLITEALNYIDNNYVLSLLMTSKPELYTKYGFRVINEYYFTKKHLHYPKKVESDLENLSIFDPNDIQKIQWAFKNNHTTSSRFYPLAYTPSFYLNMYNPILSQMVYYSPKLDVILIYEIEDETLELYDIIGPKLPELEQIYSVIPHSFKEVNLYFPPDLLDSGFTSVPYEDVDLLMVRGDMDIEELQIKLPITAEF